MDIKNVWINVDELEIKSDNDQIALSFNKNGNLHAKGEIFVQNCGVQYSDPKEFAKKTKENLKSMACSVPDESETERKIMNDVKGYTRRDAANLLGKLKANIIADTPIDSTVDEIL